MSDGAARTDEPTCSLSSLVDALLPGPAVVVGSLPEVGHDLDLLLSDADRRDAVAVLACAGSPTVFDVELLTPNDIGIPDGELRWVWSTATPLPGLLHLLAPGPAATVLLLAIRPGIGRAPLREDRTRRAHQALALPGVMEEACSHAPAWRAERAVEALAQQARTGKALGATGRYRLVREQQDREHLIERLPRLRAVARAVRRV